MSQPIKRNKNLVWLSRDHHDGLLLSWKIRQGMTYDIATDRLAKYIVYEFDKHLVPHFDDEEKLLFNGFPEDEQTKKAMQQHIALRSMAERLRSSSDIDLIREFITVLDEHIRFEERTVFPHYEQLLDEQQLVAIGAQLEATHTAPKDDNYPDPFWLKENAPQK